MFSPSAELMVERARQERRRPSLFIGRLGRCLAGEIFLMAVLIHHVLTRLTLSGHVTIAGAYPRTCRSALAATPVARRGGDHGVGVDELTMRGERRGGERRGAVGPAVSLCHR